MSHPCYQSKSKMFHISLSALVILVHFLIVTNAMETETNTINYLQEIMMSEDCVSIVISMPHLPGKYIILHILKKTNVHQVISLQLLDVGTSTLRFSDMDYFLGVCPEFICKKNTKLWVKEDMRFSTIISSTSCVVTIAKSDTNKETIQLVDFMNVMNVEKKHLYIHMSSGMESYTFKNKSINFNVVIDHESKGVFNCSRCIE